MRQEHRPRWLPPRAPADVVTTALFRNLAGLRFLVLGYAVAKNVRRIDEFDHPGAVWAAVALMIGWSALMTWAYDSPARRRLPLYVADLVVSVGVVLLTPYAESDQMYHEHAAHLASFWVIPMVLAWAIGRGPLEGLFASLVVGVADASVKLSVDDSTFGNIFLLVLAAVMVGYTASALREAAEVRAQAERVEAAAIERTRLARVVHDGVLQVLALVQRRGLEAGGEFAELGREAGEQEAALRALVQGDARATVRHGASCDLVASLQVLAGEHVTVSGPGVPVVLTGHQVGEITAAVRSCLDNVARHVGQNAPAWVLVEDLGAEVVVSVRDDGPGISEGRLDQAARDGRLGVRESVCGRIEDLGGTARLATAPGRGAEWELMVPR